MVCCMCQRTPCCFASPPLPMPQPHQPGVMRFKKVCIVMQQASEPVAALQRELEQLRINGAHMEGQFKAPPCVHH